MAVHRIRRGLDLPLAGAPVQAVADGAAVGRVALLAADYVGLKATLRVQVGEAVLRGSPLFEDKRTGVCHVSPAAGTVAAMPVAVFIPSRSRVKSLWPLFIFMVLWRQNVRHTNAVV